MRAPSFSRSLAGGPSTGPALRRVNRDRRVRLIRGRVADGEEAAAVWCAVHRCGLSTYGEVAGHVAEHLFRHDHSRAGWLGDIGLLYPWYRQHACQVLEQLDGTLVQIDSV
jgi:hypothetical protein